jgi:hypothetical protein
VKYNCQLIVLILCGGFYVGKKTRNTHLCRSTILQIEYNCTYYQDSDNASENASYSDRVLYIHRSSTVTHLIRIRNWHTKLHLNNLYIRTEVFGNGHSHDVIE